MATTKALVIHFKWINLYANDLDESILYYKKLGFTVTCVDTHDYIMKLSNESDFAVRLMCAHEYRKGDGEWSLELEADLENGYSHSKAFQELTLRGIRFENVEPNEVLHGVIYQCGQLVDPNGYHLELMQAD